MKQGIHLGAPLRTGRRVAVFALWIALAATLLHGVVYFSSRLDLAAEREATVGRRQLPLDDAATRVTAPGVSSQLAAVLDLGVAEPSLATELLDEIASRLPASVTLSSLGFSRGSGAEAARLVLEGIADDAASVSELQRNLSESPLVERTRILEERRAPSGSLGVRVQLDLARKSSR